MNIYVDETFIGDYTIIGAIKISDKKIRECLIAIKKLNNWEVDKIIKSTDIRRLGKRSNINASVRIITKKAAWTNYWIIKAKQNTKEFYNKYYETLKTIRYENPNIDIVVDNFGGSHKIENHNWFKFVKSSQNSGVQVADIFLVDKRNCV